MATSALQPFRSIRPARKRRSRAGTAEAQARRILTDILHAYGYQPSLEKRHHELKSVQDATPVTLKSPTRIEALFWRQFIALLRCLIERELTGRWSATASPSNPLSVNKVRKERAQVPRLSEIAAELPFVFLA